MLAIIKKLNKLINDCKSIRENTRLIVRMTAFSSADKDVLDYLTNLLKNIEIKIGGCQKENVIDLINSNRLEGWCWQSSETVALMLKDTDYVERGTLYLPEEGNRPYYHSWTCFEFNDKEYILDPALNILCLRDDYFEKYKIELSAVIPAKEVKDKFIYEISHKKEREPSFLDEYLSEETIERLNKETLINGSQNLYDPFYISDIGYIADIKDDKINSVVAHYYYQEA